MRTYYLAILYLLLITSCGSEETSEPAKIEKEIIPFEYAEHLEVSLIDDTLEIRVYNPDTDELETAYTLHPDSTYNVISLSSTSNGMFSALNLGQQITGISDRQYLHDKKLIKRYDDGHIKEFGESTAQSVEKIIKSDADIVFYSAFGDAFPNAEQLIKLGVKIIPLYDWREETALGKAEWIKLIGLIMDRKEEADQFFDTVKEEYNSLVDLAKEVQNKPTVFAGNIYGDVWFAPSGNSFGAQLIRNAGGEYVYSDKSGPASLSLSLEQVLDKNQTTEFWLNPGSKTKKEVLQTNPHADNLQAFNNMYGYSGNINYFWERSSIEPHLLLSDLIKIFHPELLPEHDFNFYSKIN